MVLKDDVLAQVRAIRRDFEHRIIAKETLVRLYSEYAPGIDADAFVELAEKIFPRLNCGLATVYLKSKLGGEIVRGKYEQEAHTFLRIMDDLIVDVTADQFGGPDVYVGPCIYPWNII